MLSEMSQAQKSERAHVFAHILTYKLNVCINAQMMRERKSESV
jgi:hypothetical protein